MQMALIQGTATSTVKHPSLDGVRLLICQFLGSNGKVSGDPVLAIDKIGARRGDKVILTSDGKGLRELLNDDTCPARWWTLGIADD